MVVRVVVTGGASEHYYFQLTEVQACLLFYTVAICLDNAFCPA